MEEAVVTPRRSFEIFVTKAENDANDGDHMQEAQRDCLNPEDEVYAENFLHPNASMNQVKTNPSQEIQKFFGLKNNINTDTITDSVMKGDKRAALETSSSLKNLRKKNKSPSSCTCSAIF